MFIIVMVALKRTQTDGPYMFSTQIPGESHLPAAASPLTPATQDGFDGSGRRLVLSRSSIMGSNSAMVESEPDVERALFFFFFKSIYCPVRA